MAFIPNQQDIIVDARLTEQGRLNLANGLPLATQFALGDDEIDYRLYNPNNTSGSAYYDIDIRNTPVFEATTLSSRLFTYAPGVQFLPVLKLNQSTKVSSNLTILGTYTNAINIATTDAMVNFVDTTNQSWIDGRRNLITSISIVSQQAQIAGTTRFIRVDQGFDTQTAVIPLGNLEESGFFLYLNRLFLKLTDREYNSNQVEPFTIANPYTRSQATDVYSVSTEDSRFFGTTEVKPPLNNVAQLATSLATNIPEQVGRQLQFSLQASDFLASNLSYDFTNYGQLYTSTLDGYLNGMTAVSAGDGVYYISTTVRVTGASYGFSVDIPVKLFYK